MPVTIENFDESSGGYIGRERVRVYRLDGTPYAMGDSGVYKIRSINGSTNTAIAFPVKNKTIIQQLEELDGHSENIPDIDPDTLQFDSETYDEF